MGKGYVQFACHHCNHCCRDVICLPTPWDVIRIVRDTGANPYEFLVFIGPDEIEGVSKSDPTWLRVNGKKYLMGLRRDKYGCFFLNKKTTYCGIYESRPLLCRLYPFKLHETREGTLKKFTLHGDVGCPRHRDGKVATDPLYEIYLVDKDNHEDYGNLVEAFNNRDYPGKQPHDFIDMFVTGIEKPRIFGQNVRRAPFEKALRSKSAPQ